MTTRTLLTALLTAALAAAPLLAWAERSVNVGIGKARTAAIYRRPTREFEEQIRNGRIGALALVDATPLQGGVPVVLNGRVVGAIGVSGDTPQVDEDIAIAGARAFR